jgi:MFS family permease
MIFTWGTTFSFGVFFEPLSAALGLPPLKLSLVYSVQLLSFYGVAGLLGIVLVKRRARPVLLAISMIMGVLSFGFQYVTSLELLVIYFSLLGMSLGTTYVILVSIIPQWFEDYRGIAMGILFTGNGIGMLVLPPAWGWAVQHYGLGTAFMLITLINTIVFFTTAVAIRRPDTGNNGQLVQGSDVREWLRSLLARRDFWLTFLGTGFLFGWYFLLSTHAIMFFRAQGLSRGAATTVFGFIGGISVISRLASGFISDFVGARRSIFGAALLTTLGFLVLLLDGMIPIYVSVVLFGIGLGTNATLYIPVIMSHFNPDWDTALVGIFNLSLGLMAFLVPPGSTAVAEIIGFNATLALTGIATSIGVAVFLLGTTRLHSPDDSRH